MGPELVAIVELLNQFYDTATQAGSNEGRYRKAGKYFADAVTKIGFDVLLAIVLHKASVPLKRKWVNYRQSLGGGEVRPGVVEEPVGEQPGAKRQAEIEAERAKRKEQQKTEKQEKEARKKAEQEQKARVAREKAQAIEELEKRYAPQQPPAEEYAKIEAGYELKYGSKSTKVVTVITDKKTGKVYTGRNGKVKNVGELDPRTQERLPKESQHKNGETWDTYNCAEVDALDQATKDGADPSDLEMHTLEIDRETGDISSKERCENCKVTTYDIKTTSDSKP